MTPPTIALIILAVGLLAVILAVGRRLARNWHRDKLEQTPFPDAWRTILEEDFPLYPKLPAALRDQLHHRIQVLLAEKTFIGCGGLEVTDEMRVLIAAQAAVLILNRDTSFYSGLHTIFIYPSAYVARNLRTDASGVQHESGDVRLGESWQNGPLVLSWDDVNRGAYNVQDGHNVTMHEFAHQLDQEDDASDGTPILDNCTAHTSWAATFKHDFVALREKLEHGGKDLLDDYAATDPAEFFAVATEVFFEKPVLLHKRHPRLYAELRDYYKLDPLEWDA